MCGISGVLSRNKLALKPILQDMCDSLMRRGPNGHGYYINQTNTVGLGHRRLAILDLSDRGSQPMISKSGRFAITFNGEIYNFQTLRTELESLGHKFRGSSDTEVILAALEEWEIYEAIPKFNGMFALSIWDDVGQRLYLIRDRLGVKPLYWGIFNNSLVFASELKAIQASGMSDRKLSPDGLSHYMRFGYIPAPLTIYENIYKIKQGSILSFDLALNRNEFQYWAPSTFALAQSRTCDDVTTYRQHLHALLRDSVKTRMVADVPSGVFLSGGIDSSLVTALMQEQSATPVKTFTIGFSENTFNEAPFAKNVAEALGTNHTSAIITPHEAQSIIPDLPNMFDEPFGDSSAIPTALLAHLTSKHVTVALSGDGGDELFLGYPRYHAAIKIWNIIKFLPLRLRRYLGQSIGAVNETTLNSLLSPLNNIAPAHLKIERIGHRFKKFADRIDADPFTALYRNIISHWPKNTVTLSTGKIMPFVDDDIENDLHELSFMSLYDLVSYLPDDIMTKVDRTSMWHGLEAREPLLDHRIVEFALKGSNNLKIRGGESKWILKRILETYLPAKLFDRPKMGFAVPLGSWLKNDLKPWAEDLLRADEQNYFRLLDKKIIQQHWQEHQSGQADHSYLLWDLLMLLSWLRTWKPEVSHLEIH